MKFLQRKRRQPPAIIIVSLIDILIVLLIFMMVTTTFKQHPSVRLALPESKTPREGATSEPSLVVTVAQKPPHFFLGANSISLEELQKELKNRAAANPKVELTIRADDGAPFGQIVKVMDAAKAARIRTASAMVKQAGSQ